nr:hypothetical protein [Tanacetum cinerariifolium]
SLKIRVLRWTVLIDRSLVLLTVLIEITALKTILVVILLSRLMKSRWTCLIRNILMILNEISDCCSLKLLDVIMEYEKIISASNSSFIGLTVLILIEIVALETVLVVVLMSRLIKSRWTHLVRNILTVLNEISDSCGLKLLDVIVKYWKIISSSRVMKEFFISLRDFLNRFMRMSSLSSRDAAICWRSKEFEWEEEEGRGAFAFALTSVTLLLEYLTFDLLSMIDKHSRGILSKKFPPAAKSSAS